MLGRWLDAQFPGCRERKEALLCFDFAGTAQLWGMDDKCIDILVGWLGGNRVFVDILKLYGGKEKDGRGGELGDKSCEYL